MPPDHKSYLEAPKLQEMASFRSNSAETPHTTPTSLLLLTHDPASQSAVLRAIH